MSGNLPFSADELVGAVDNFRDSITSAIELGDPVAPEDIDLVADNSAAQALGTLSLRLSGDPEIKRRGTELKGVLLRLNEGGLI
jgi:hypothetical protein